MSPLTSSLPWEGAAGLAPPNNAPHASAAPAVASPGAAELPRTEIGDGLYNKKTSWSISVFETRTRGASAAEGRGARGDARGRGAKGRDGWGTRGWGVRDGIRGDGTRGTGHAWDRTRVTGRQDRARSSPPPPVRWGRPSAAGPAGESGPAPASLRGGAPAARRRFVPLRPPSVPLALPLPRPAILWPPQLGSRRLRSRDG